MYTPRYSKFWVVPVPTMGCHPKNCTRACHHKICRQTRQSFVTARFAAPPTGACHRFRQFPLPGWSCEYSTSDALDRTSSVGDIEYGPWGSPWASSCGYRVADDGWILDAGGKQVLMLPPLWQSTLKGDRVWNGKFLALLHVELPEVVILELEP